MISNNLASTEWLYNNLYSSELFVLRVDFKSVKSDTDLDVNIFIPNSHQINLSEICMSSSKIPNTVPNYLDFAVRVRSMGISNSHIVVLYDVDGIYAAPRLWWIFKLMGHDKVKVLDGGLKKWIFERRPIKNTFLNSAYASNWIGCYQKSLICYKENINLAINNPSKSIIIDARSYDRFCGRTKEPRTGVKSGHIPTAINLPYRFLLTDQSTYKSKQEVRQIF